MGAMRYLEVGVTWNCAVPNFLGAQNGDLLLPKIDTIWVPELPGLPSLNYFSACPLHLSKL